MKVIYAKIKNILGLDELEMEPGQITVLSGKNGLGKSSFVEALRNVVAGGNLKTIRNVNATDDDPSEIALVFDSDDGRVLVSKTEKGLTVKTQVGDSAAYRTEVAPKTFLDQLSDAKARNPMELITAKDKEIVDRILGAIDLPYDTEAMWNAIGLDKSNFVTVPPGMHPLQEIAVVHDLVFRERTGVNRDEKQKRGSCEQTRRAIPEVIPVVEGVESLSNEIQKLRSDRQASIASADKDLELTLLTLDARESVMKKEAATNLFKFQAELDMEVAQRIEEKRADMLAWLEGGKEELDKDRRVANEKHNSDLAILDYIQNLIVDKERELAILREQEKDSIRIRTLKEQADQFESEAGALKGRSVQLTSALEALSSYKANMCKEIPIPGLDITDGVVMVNGIPWGQLNTARRIELAVKISCLKMADSKYRLVFVDGAEALDSESFAELVKNLKDANAQAFIGRVEDHDLKVEVL